MSRPALCLSNDAFPACSAAEIREAILKAFAFGERGPPSSIGKGSSREKPSLLLLLHRFPTAQKAGEGSAQCGRTCAKMGFSHSATGAPWVRESVLDCSQSIPTAIVRTRKALRCSDSCDEPPNTSWCQNIVHPQRERENASLVSPPVVGGVVSSESCLEEKLLLLRECQK